MRSFFSEAVFLPRMMVLVASNTWGWQGRCWEFAHRHKAMTSARILEELKHHPRGF